MKFSVILCAIVFGIVVASSDDEPKKREKRTIILSSFLKALILKEAALGTALNFIQSPQVNALFPIGPVQPRANLRQGQGRNQNGAVTPAPPMNSSAPPPMMMPANPPGMMPSMMQPMPPMGAPMMPAQMMPQPPQPAQSQMANAGAQPPPNPMQAPMMPAQQPPQPQPQNPSQQQPPQQQPPQQQPAQQQPPQQQPPQQQPPQQQSPQQQPPQQQPPQQQAGAAQPQPPTGSQAIDPANPPPSDQGQQDPNAQPGVGPSGIGVGNEQSVDPSAIGGSIDTAGAITGPGANSLPDISGQTQFGSPVQGTQLSLANQGLAANIGRSSVFGTNQIAPETSESFVSLPNGYQFTNYHTQNEHYLPSSEPHLSSFHNNFETFPRNYHYQYSY